MIIVLLLLIAGLACFVAAALNAQSTRFNLIAAGLACTTAALIVPLVDNLR